MDLNLIFRIVLVIGIIVAFSFRIQRALDKDPVKQGEPSTMGEKIASAVVVLSGMALAGMRELLILVQ